MGRTGVAAGLENVHERHEIGLNIGVGMCEAVANTGLRRQMDDAIEVTSSQALMDNSGIG
jgi:hypothetical protein